MPTNSATGEITIDTDAFVIRALKYKLRQMYPEHSDLVITQMAKILQLCCKGRPGGPNVWTESAEQMKALGAPEFDFERIRHTAWCIGGAIVGLGIDMEDPGSERLVRWD